MKPENEQHLRRTYPLAYASPFINDEPFRCDDGWFEILRDLGAQLEVLIAHEPEARRPLYRVAQVKEKLGTLRVYLDHGSTLGMAAAITAAEERSAVTCEKCGQPGSLRTVGWVRTLCDACAGSGRKV